jgi:hypothetical protein
MSVTNYLLSFLIVITKMCRFLRADSYALIGIPTSRFGGGCSLLALINIG